MPFLSLAPGGGAFPRLLLPALCVAAVSARAAVLPVHPDGSGPYPSLQAAVDAAAPGDTVELAPGEYRQTAVVDQKHLTVRGRDGAGPTVIDMGFTSRALTLIRTGNPCRIEGITFRYCRAGAIQFPANTGGAVAAFACPLVVRDCVFRKNNASLGTGGAVYCTIPYVPGFGNPLPIDDPADARLLIEDTLFDDNDAGDAGGAVFTDDTPAVIRRCTFTGNTGLVGGALALLNGPGDVEDCVFDGNTAATHGGALHLSGFGPYTVTGSRFQDNLGKKLGGAALVEVSFRTEFTGCAFLGNRAEYEGGGIHARISGFAVDDCLFAGNTAGGDGGGGISVLDLDEGAVSKCTFIENSAPGGRSVFAKGSTLTLESCLVADSGDAVLCRTASAVTGACNAGAPGAAGCLSLTPVDAVARCPDQPLRLCSVVEIDGCGRVGHDYEPCPAGACLTPARPVTWGAIKRRY